MGFTYPYVEDLRPGENQYDALYDLDQDTIVDAIYIHSENAPGNPYIEALPKPWSIKEIAQNYNQPIRVPTVEQLLEMDEYDRDDNIDIGLDEFRVNLPFHATVEKQFHRALVRSYAKRKTIEDKRINVKLHVEDEEVVTHNRLEVKHMSDPVGGFTLLGSGGCGKSTGINMMLAHYPQTIIHQRETWQRTYQIVYLLVQCTANSNFSKLYENIGEAIDRALGNFNPIYKLEFRKGGLADKYDLLKQLVMRFSIGCIILDEIELMDIKSTKESSLEAIMTLTNETGVAISVIGTMDAYKQLFFKARTARRMGVSIIASKYCYDETKFCRIINLLTIFQWGESVDYTDELIHALYVASHGVISDLIEIYKLIQKDRIKNLPSSDSSEKEKNEWRKKSAPEVTAQYIAKKAETYYEILSQARALEDNPVRDDNQRLIASEISRLNTAAEMTDQAQMEKRYDEVMADPAYRKFVMMRTNVVADIRAMKLGYREITIERAFSIVMKNQSLEMELSKVTALTMAYLERGKEKREERKKQKTENRPTVDWKTLQQQLLENNQ